MDATYLFHFYPDKMDMRDTRRVHFHEDRFASDASAREAGLAYGERFGWHSFDLTRLDLKPLGRVSLSPLPTPDAGGAK